MKYREAKGNMELKDAQGTNAPVTVEPIGTDKIRLTQTGEDGRINSIVLPVDLAMVRDLERHLERNSHINI